MEPEYAIDKEQIYKILKILRRGGIILYPTESLYGLGADPFNPSALEKLGLIKGRDAKKPYILLVDSLEMGFLMAENPIEPARHIAEKCWPGAVTLLLRPSQLGKKALPEGVDTIALRHDTHPIPNAIIRAMQNPLLSTSANLSGAENPLHVEQISREILDQVDGVVDGPPAPHGSPSTIIDATRFPPTLVREGMISISEIESRTGIQIRQ